MNKKDLNQLKTNLTEIAEIYKVNLVFDPKASGGEFKYPNKIIVGTFDISYKRVLEIFCHEMGHFLNAQNNKYPFFHKTKTNSQKDFYKKFKTQKGVVAYVLRAEIYTDKVAKKFAREWFPDLKYDRTYYNTPRIKGYLSYVWSQYE